MLIVNILNLIPCYGKKKYKNNIFTNFIDFIDHKYEINESIHNIIAKELVNLDKTLIVNVWDCFSIVGNGNFHDDSLDGHLERISAMSVLCWPYTNRNIKSVQI